MNTAISVFKIILKSSFGLKLPSAPGNDCIVLGNGPSLNDSFQKHPDFFKKYPLICVNNFSQTEQFTDLKPLYYVMLDPNYWLGKSENVREAIRCLKEKTSWKMYLFVPPSAKNAALLQEVLTANPNIRVHYFNYTVFKGFPKVAFWFYKKNLAMPQSQNVLVASLFLALNTGFKNIYLFGADHSWHQNLYVNEENVLCLKDVHFYENAEKVNYRIFYKGEHTKETFRMDEILNTLAKAFYGYIAINNYAIHCDASVYNASEISYIDAFKRIKL
jgi:hypothetical protein